MKKSILIATVVLFPLLGFGQIQGVYEIRFTSGTTQHRAALIIFSDGTGKIRVRYFSEGRTKMVEQYVRTENTRYGLRLACYNPVYPGTSTRFPNYITDNFYLSQDEYGNVSVLNVDDSGGTSRAWVRVFQSTYDRNQFLTDFNWHI
ncbi:hypothetical protein [Spirosoma aerolatum]|uniref:hypothetical protein n=1 Tax=Spirosoma aerolatum TaxID=1211326 RepID=UPI0009AEE9E8|nr:hypothetical protein [Spirosoma aerolatum]